MTTTLRVRPAESVGRVAVMLSIAFAAVLAVVPLIWAASASFKYEDQIFTYPPTFWPSPFTLSNWLGLNEKFPFLRWTINTIAISAAGTVFGVTTASMAGYAFAKFRFRGDRLLFSLALTSLLVPFVVLLIPLFILVSDAGFRDTYIAQVFPFLAPAFGVYLMRQFIEHAVPSELLEAARIDGAGEFRIFRQIVLPLVRPATASLAMWLFLSIYNSFLWPLVIVTSRDKFTIPIGLNVFLSTYNRNYGFVTAGATAAAIPSILLFLALQKQYVQGLAAGSLKG